MREYDLQGRMTNSNPYNLESIKSIVTENFTVDIVTNEAYGMVLWLPR